MFPSTSSGIISLLMVAQHYREVSFIPPDVPTRLTRPSETWSCPEVWFRSTGTIILVTFCNHGCVISLKDVVSSQRSLQPLCPAVQVLTGTNNPSMTCQWHVKESKWGGDQRPLRLQGNTVHIWLPETLCYCVSTSPLMDSSQERWHFSKRVFLKCLLSKVKAKQPGSARWDESKSWGAARCSQRTLRSRSD